MAITSTEVVSNNTAPSFFPFSQSNETLIGTCRAILVCSPMPGIMEDEMVNLCLADEEEDVFQENPETTALDLQFCLVEACLMNSVVHFPSLQNTMADL
ncbi:hypothetical protein Gotri_019192 [Gossypium trilobum]|uniref:Uncharacterized protein n=1 Tax=Gossypium trilobum TaxID=34281 RepID=A0A7J9EC02_9ROSI|nr:hypothetical protein [Gossypium trilobum]